MALTSMQRAARDVDFLSREDAARRLGLKSGNAVTKRLSRARRREGRPSPSKLRPTLHRMQLMPPLTLERLAG